MGSRDRLLLTIQGEGRFVNKLMIKSKRFKAIVKAKRRLMFDDWKSNHSPYGPSIQDVDHLSFYLEGEHPERVKAYKRVTYLMSIAAKEADIYWDIVNRFRQLALLSTIDLVIAAMKKRPEIVYGTSIVVLANDRNKNKSVTAPYHPEIDAPTILSSPLITNFKGSNSPPYICIRLWCYKPTSSMPIHIGALITPKFFKLTHAEMELRSLEIIFSWVGCDMVPRSHGSNLDAAELTSIRDATKKSLITYYNYDPVYFTLLNQAARLLMP